MRPKTPARKTLDFLAANPKGTVDAIHVGCWDQPAIGIVQALEEAGRTEINVTAPRRRSGNA